MDLFTLVARLGMDTSEYDSRIGSARNSFSSMANTISAKAVAMGKIAADALEKAANMAVDLGKSAINAAAEVSAENAQFAASFGELQGSAEKAFDRVSKSTGIFSTRLRTVGTKAFSQFKGAGLDAVDALDSMEQYTNLAADAAAYYDISLEEADEKLRSFLRGNTEAGDAIGLFTSESQRNTYAMEKYGAKWTALTEAQKQMLMLDVAQDIYEQSGAIGQAARESDNWTNVIGNLKEGWRQALALFGEPIKFVLTPILKDVTEWLADPENLKKLDQFGLTVANMLSDAIDWILNPTFPTWEEIKAGASGIFSDIQAGLETAVNWTLGKIGMPDAEIVKADVQNWWTGQGDNAYERIKSVLTWSFGKWVAPAASEYTDDVKSWWDDTFMPSLTKITQWTFGELLAPAWADLVFGLVDWWNNIKPKIKQITTWEVGKAKWPSLSEMVASAKEWWNSVKGTLLSIFTIAISPTYRQTVPQSSIDAAMNDYADVIDAVTGATSNAVGLDYVPYNNYFAKLHEGEAVLTKAEATDWRAGANAGGMDTALLNDIRSLLQVIADKDTTIMMDGRVVADLVTPKVSHNIVDGMRSKRYW